MGSRFSGAVASSRCLSRRGASECRNATAADGRATSCSSRWPAEPTTASGDDLAALLHEEIDRLPDRFRVPIVLCELEGYTCEQAARHIGCPVGTVAKPAGPRSRTTAPGPRPSRRRAFGPAIGIALSSEANGTFMHGVARRCDSPWDKAVRLRATASCAGEFSFRSMMMARWISVAAGMLAVGSIAVGWGLGRLAERQSSDRKDQTRRGSEAG